MSVYSWLLTPLTLTLALSGQAAAPAAAPTQTPQARATVAGQTWGPVRELGRNPHGQSLVVDSRSTVTVVWAMASASHAVVAQRRPAGGPWGRPVVIGHGTYPQVAADARGNVTAVWLTVRRGFTDGVVAARRPVGGRWSDPVRISRDLRVPGYPADGKGPYGADDVRLAVAPGGGAVAVWAWGSESRRKPWRIQSVHRRAGGRWGDVASVTPASSARHPQVGMDCHGTAVLLYGLQHLGDSQALKVRRRIPGVGWTKPVTVAAEGYGESLAVDRAGNAVVAFTPDFGTVKAVYRPVDGRWGPARRLSPRGAEGEQFALAMGARGAVVAMAAEDGRVYLVRRPPRGPWSAPMQLSAPGSGAFEVLVAVNGAGDNFVGWGGYALYGRYRPHGGGWADRVTLSPDAGVEVLEDVLSRVAPNGDVAVLWTQEGLPLKVRVMTAG